MHRVRLGIYGNNGHQLLNLPDDATSGGDGVQIVATAGFDPAASPRGATHHDTLDALLADDRVELVSICSPRRADQADDAVNALRAGRHVYAEKPAALTEADLDRIIQTARETGRLFHEMGNGLAWTQPYLPVRRVVEAEMLGQVVQVFAQKSYPWAEWRPDDEAVDGGLIAQSAGHALRMVEQVAGQRIAAIDAVQTDFGCTARSPSPMAAALTMRLENGGLATAIANYLNPPAFGVWGHDVLRIFGTRGMVEVTDGGRQTRLVLDDCDHGPLNLNEPSVDPLATLLKAVRGRRALPYDLDAELRPTRWALRARDAARHAEPLTLAPTPPLNPPPGSRT